MAGRPEFSRANAGPRKGRISNAAAIKRDTDMAGELRLYLEMAAMGLAITIILLIMLHYVTF
jgi:hypothetical protein